MNLKQNIFKQPDGYQDELKDKVLAQIAKKQSHAAINPKVVIGVAAFILLVIGFTFIQQTKSNSKTQTVSKDLIYSYFYENVDDLDEEDLYLYIDVKPDISNTVTIDDIIFDNDTDTDNFIY